LAPILGFLGQKVPKNGQQRAKISVFLLLVSNLCVFVCCSFFAVYEIVMAEKVIIIDRGVGVRAILANFLPEIYLKKWSFLGLGPAGLCQTPEYERRRGRPRYSRREASAHPD
jgi:hypothetical protein